MSEKNKKVVNPVEVTEIGGFEKVDETLTKSEAFIENNSKQLSIGLLVVILLVVAFFCYKNYYSEPRELEAKNLIYKAEQWFARDSFKLALEGDENFEGFESIADQYGSTSAGKLAKVYAGLCCKNLGQTDKALNYLKSFSVDDEFVSPALKGSIGDCYLEIGEKDKAIEFYKKAASVDNILISPIYLQRAGLVYLNKGNKSDALKLFEEIKAKYPNSVIAMDIDKYIALAK